MGERTAPSSPLRSLLEALPLVPDCYAFARPLVADALAFFLERLPAQRQAEIVAQQLSAGPQTSVEARLVQLLHACPTLHKLGQVVAHDRRIDPAVRARLQSLESLPPSMGVDAIVPLLERELGSIPSEITLADAALAEGSVAIVLPFVWTPADGERRRGVFKVVKPQAEERMQQELALWPALGSYLEERCAHYGLPALEYRNTLESVRRLLLVETRLDREQEHLLKAARFYAAVPTVRIPAVFPFCTPRVTAMERMDGRKVTDPRLPPRIRRRLAGLLIDSLLAKPFWSPEPLAVFHADPHAGNLLATPDGHLAILDWALIVEFRLEQRAAVVQAILGAFTLDEGKTMRALADMGRIVDEARLQCAVRESLRRVRHGTLPGFEWLSTLVERLVADGAMEFPEELALLSKALLTLSDVVGDVSGRASIPGTLTRAGTAQFFRDLVRRPRAPLESRAFGSHLSNEDLLRTWAALFFIPSRFWLATWRDALGAWTRAAAALDATAPATEVVSEPAPSPEAERTRV